MKFIDITNQKFNMLTVLEKSGHKNNRIIWKCQCDCGKIIYENAIYLKNGRRKSCGCLNRQRLIQIATKHNLSKTRVYKCWIAIKKRCFNSNCDIYPLYGGRGITMCDEWKNDFLSFYNWSMQNGYKDTLTIDRIDNNGNYEPSNCRWTNWITQNNNRRNNHLITYNDKTLSLSQWAKEYDINLSTFTNRIRRGWSIEKALTTPPRK